MKFSRMLAMLLIFSVILSVGASAAGADKAGKLAEPDKDAPAAGSEDAAEHEADGADAPAGFLVLDRHTSKVSLEGVTVTGDVLIRSVCSGERTAGGALEITLRDVDAAGDILHEDGHGAMVIALEGTQLTGAVNAAERTEEIEPAGQPAEEVEEADEDGTGREAGDQPASGVHMTMDGASAWTVTGESKLAGFSQAQGAIVAAPGGQSLAVYVDCTPDEAGNFDASTGTYIASFVADVEYANVVLQVWDGEEETEAETDLFAALGIGTTVVDGEYSVALEAFLEAMGVEVVYDEATGGIIIEDPNGVLDFLSDGTE